METSSFSLQGQADSIGQDAIAKIEFGHNAGDVDLDGLSEMIKGTGATPVILPASLVPGSDDHWVVCREAA